MLRILLAVAAALVAVTPAGAAWHEATTKHFVIYSEQSPRDLQAFATRLEKFDKAVRVLRKMDDPPIGQSGRVTIFVLSTTDAVSRLATGKVTSIAGFYIPRAAGSVAFVPKRAGSGSSLELDADGIFFHEYAHHMLLQNSDAPFPPWFVEGFAEFFSRAEFPKDGSVQLGLPASHRAYALFALDKPNLQELLGATFKTKNEEESEKLYSRGWLLTHYLAFEPARKGQLATYVRGIERGLAPLMAAQTAFGDLKALDSDLDRYLRRNKLTYLKVSGPELTVPPATVRQLAPGEAAAMQVRMISARGVDKERGKQALQMARSVAAAFPTDPAVQAALAEAEFDVENFKEAAAAADRVLAANSRSMAGLLYKGRAEMELATSNSDWGKIRAWFLEANKVDPEAAEPLRLFYESFYRAGDRPTENAVEGLLYAQVLARQDGGLRLNAAEVLIEKNRLDEARKLLAPLANSPHDGRGRESARKVLARLEARVANAVTGPTDSGKED